MAQLLPDCRLNYFWIGGSPNTGLPAQRMAEYSKEYLNTNIGVPLRAIFLLERAEEGEADLVEELGTAQAILKLGPHTYEPEGPNSLLRVMQLLRLMTKHVKIYRLRCAPTVEAVRLAWETARPKK